MDLQEKRYLDFDNNFLTVACFAEYYSMSIKQANTFIDNYRLQCTPHFKRDQEMNLISK